MQKKAYSFCRKYRDVKVELHKLFFILCPAKNWVPGQTGAERLAH